jgi:hypothetical protein
MGCGGDLLSPGSYSPSTIGAGKLNYCVRDGNRCGLPANATTDLWLEAYVIAKRILCEECCFVWEGGGCELKASRAISITRLNALPRLHL